MRILTFSMRNYAQTHIICCYDTSSIYRDISIFLGCTKTLNLCNSDADARVTVIALHIHRIIEIKAAVL